MKTVLDVVTNVVHFRGGGFQQNPLTTPPPTPPPHTHKLLHVVTTPRTPKTPKVEQILLLIHNHNITLL